jgi:hypothetical protein
MHIITAKGAFPFEFTIKGNSLPELSRISLGCGPVDQILRKSANYRNLTNLIWCLALHAAFVS